MVLKKIAVILIIILIVPSCVHAQQVKYVEIFSPKQNKVIKKVKLTPEIEKLTLDYLNNIDSLYGKLDPVTEDGYAIKVPFSKPITIKNKWINSTLNEVFLLIPEKEPPFILLFENGDRMLCFPLNGNVEALSKALNFTIEVYK